MKLIIMWWEKIFDFTCNRLASRIKIEVELISLKKYNLRNMRDIHNNILLKTNEWDLETLGSTKLTRPAIRYSKSASSQGRLGNGV